MRNGRQSKMFYFFFLANTLIAAAFTSMQFLILRFSGAGVSGVLCDCGDSTKRYITKIFFNELWQIQLRLGYLLPRKYGPFEI